MRRSLAYIFPIISILHPPAVSATTTVLSLEQVRAAIQTEDARRLFDSSLSDTVLPDGLGRHLPPGFSREFLFQQLAPAGLDPRRLVLAGAKPWLQRPNSFVGMICVAKTVEAAAQARKYDAGNCQSLPGDSDEKEIWIGVFEGTPYGAPKRIARTDAPVATPTDWSATDIDIPTEIASQEGEMSKKSRPMSWKRFDLAHYQIRPGQVAFGLRAGWNEGYAGGGAQFEALYLFHIDGSSLKVAFAQPMTFTKMIAGEWKPDGTRRHDVSDTSNTLIMLPGMTNGYFDIQLRQQRGDWKRTLTWSPDKQAYE